MVDRGVGDRAAGAQASGRAEQLWKPHEKGQPSRERPDRQRSAPAAAEDRQQRRGQPGGEGRADEQRHRVQAHHQPGAVGEVLLDRRGHHDVPHRDRGADEHGAGEQGGHARLVPQQVPRREDQQHDPEQSVHAEPPGQARGEERERPEHEHGDRGQQAHDGRRQAQRGTDLADHRSDRGDADAQVQPDQDQSDAEQQQSCAAEGSLGGLAHLRGGGRRAGGDGERLRRGGVRGAGRHGALPITRG